MLKSVEFLFVNIFFKDVSSIVAERKGENEVEYLVYLKNGENSWMTHSKLKDLELFKDYQY